ncbi:MAG: EamA family transporter [bacterium]|nr:EamA family transporter [bacterium]
MQNFSWLFYAVGSAVFAALTSILAKVGIEGVNSNLATAIRTVVVLILAWALVFIFGWQKQLIDLTPRNWLFLILSGVATGLSWLFFYRALQLGNVAKVLSVDKLSLVLAIVFAALFLGEKLSWQAIIGVVLIVAGTFLVAR